MRKSLSFIAALAMTCIASHSGWAQSMFCPKQEGDRCGTKFNSRELETYEPAAYKNWQAIERFTQKYIKERQAATKGGVSQRVSDPAVTITIPVVVHVVYNTSDQNISVAQIQSQIDVLNEDYQRRNADANQTPSQFSGVAGNINIAFKLACVDPNGNSTTGIERAYTSKTGFSVSYTNATTPNETAIGVKFVSGAAAWPASTYLNIWTCNFVDNTLGYSRFPGTAPANVDGVVIGYDAMGRVGTLKAQYNKGRTATHEVGHWLNLIHVWGDSNCGNDFCGDTPTQLTANYGCVSFPHATCSNNGDMSMNYMDYSDDACMNLFTNDQKNRMRSLFAAGGFRESFISTKIQESTTQICSGSTTFSVAANVGATVNYNWTVTGPLQISSGQGTNQITCSQNGTDTGTATVTVSANGYCDSRTIQVGPDPASGTYSTDQYGQRTQMTGSYQFVQANKTYYIWMDQPYDFTFTTVGPNSTAGVPIYKTGPQSAYFYFPGSSVQVRANANNSMCGSSLASVFVAPYQFTTTPNPASSELTVVTETPDAFKTDASRASTAPLPFDAELYNTFGRKVKTQKSTQGKVVFDVSDLPAGVYTMRVGSGKSAYTERVQITH